MKTNKDRAPPVQRIIKQKRTENSLMAMTKADKDALMRAIDIIDSLGCWDEREFTAYFGTSRADGRKKAMAEIRDILNRY